MSQDSSSRRRPTDVVWLHRLFDWGAPRCPHFLEPGLRLGWVAIFLLLAGRERRAVAENLRALGVVRGWFGGIWGAAQVFWQFAGSLLDGARLRAGEEFCWEVAGTKNFEVVEVGGRGALVATAHMGTYDTAAGAFAAHFPGGLELVRYREPDPRIDARRSAQLRRELEGKVAIHYNEGANSQLGLELLRALREQRSVAIQADRPLAGLSAVTVVRDGVEMSLPDGPWVLAAAARVPVFPVFCWKVGPDRYRLQIGTALDLTGGTRANRKEVGEVMQAWAGVLLAQLERAWRQWYVFEPVVRRVGEAEEDAENVAEIEDNGGARQGVDGEGGRRISKASSKTLGPPDLVLGAAVGRRGIWWGRGAQVLFWLTLGLPWLGRLPMVWWWTLPIWMWSAGLTAGVICAWVAGGWRRGRVSAEELRWQRQWSGLLLGGLGGPLMTSLALGAMDFRAQWRHDEPMVRGYWPSMEDINLMILFLLDLVWALVGVIFLPWRVQKEGTGDEVA